MEIVQTTLSASANFQLIHETCDSKIAHYAARMLDGDKFPPIRAVDYGTSIMMIDGHHRVKAARIANMPVAALIASGDEFEDLDCAVRHQGKRADDAEFWTT
jgi:hypothetical protein